MFLYVCLSELYTKIDYPCYSFDVQFCFGGMYADSEESDFD